MNGRKQGRIFIPFSSFPYMFIVTEEGFIKVSTKPVAPSASEDPSHEEEGQDGQQSEEEIEGDDGPVFTSLQHFRAVSDFFFCKIPNVSFIFNYFLLNHRTMNTLLRVIARFYLGY